MAASELLGANRGPFRYLLFALFLTTAAAAADPQHDEDYSSHHRHRNDQGFKVH